MNFKQILFLLSLSLILSSSCIKSNSEKKTPFDKEEDLLRFLRLNKHEITNDTILLLPTNICLTCNLPFQFVIDTLPNLTILVGSGLEKHVKLKFRQQELILFEIDELPKYGLLKYYPEVFIISNRKVIKYFPITNSESLDSFFH